MSPMLMGLLRSTEADKIAVILRKNRKYSNNNKSRRGSAIDGKAQQILPYIPHFLTLLPLAPTPLRGFSATPTLFFPQTPFVPEVRAARQSGFFTASSAKNPQAQQGTSTLLGLKIPI
jgi:hypothetical protein